MKVVLSADRADEGTVARDWCAANLDSGTTVIAVVGVSNTNEFVYGVPLFDAMGGTAAIVEEVEQNYCIPLVGSGLACQTRLVHHHQAQALVEVAEAEGADLIVVGKHPHGSFADALSGEVASRLVHQPPCTLVVVPTATRREVGASQ